MKKSYLILALVGMLTIGGTVLAFADESTPQTSNRQTATTKVESLMESGLTFEEAKEQNLQAKYERVDAAVEKGTITAERGEEIKAEMKANSEACTSPGEMRGTHEGYGLNKGQCGKGQGRGQGRGMGRGQGNCGGMGAGNGSCKVAQ